MADKISIKVEVGEDGRIMVGQEPAEAEGEGEGAAPIEGQAAELMAAGAPAGPPGGMPPGMPGGGGEGPEEGMEESYMQPVGSPEEAGAAVVQMLQAAMGGGAEPTGAAAEAQFAKGYGKPQPPTQMV